MLHPLAFSAQNVHLSFQGDVSRVMSEVCLKAAIGSCTISGKCPAALVKFWAFRTCIGSKSKKKD
jgi:hypothetical protein